MRSCPARRLALKALEWRYEGIDDADAAVQMLDAELAILHAECLTRVRQAPRRTWRDRSAPPRWRSAPVTSRLPSRTGTESVPAPTQSLTERNS